MVLMRTQQKSDLLKYLLHERNKKPKKIKSNKEAIFKKAIDLLEEYKSSPSKKKRYRGCVWETYSTPVKIFFTEAVIFPTF